MNCRLVLQCMKPHETCRIVTYIIIGIYSEMVHKENLKSIKHLIFLWLRSSNFKKATVIKGTIIWLVYEGC